MRSAARNLTAYTAVLVLVSALTLGIAPTALGAIDAYAQSPFPAPQAAHDARNFWATANRTNPPTPYTSVDPTTANRGKPVVGYSSTRDFAAVGAWPQLPAYKPTGQRVYRFFFEGPDPGGHDTVASRRWIAFGGEWTNITRSRCKKGVGQHPFTTAGPFYEYDVNASRNPAGGDSINYLGVSHRQLERLVLDTSNNEVYYTSDHYCTFAKV